MNKFNILAGLVGILTVFTGYLFLSNQINSVVNVGTELPDAPALFETSLAAPITATADSFTLTANSVRGGGSLSGYNCFTIDEGSAQAEFVCGTASSTSVTGVTRGISPSDGTSAVSALQFAHRRGASVKITDFPIIQILRNQNNGEATFENALRYAGSVTPSSADDLADVGYVLSVVNGGTVNFDALVVAGTAGETLATSTLVYFKSSDQRWFKVDTDATTTFQGVAIGLTRGAGATAGAISGGGVLLQGLQTGLSGLTAGGTYYASSSAGTFSVATSAMPIGQAKSTTELMFDPVMIGVPRLAMDNTFTGNNTFSGTTTFTGNIMGATSITVYDANATWTKPTYAKAVQIIAIGAGGGGGGGEGSGAGTERTSASGGGGCNVNTLFMPASVLPSSVAITVGAGGAGGTGGSSAGGNAGSPGGSSSFGSYLTAYGGGGGGGGTGNNSGGGGGGTAGVGGNGSGSNSTGGSPATVAAAVGIAGQGAGGGINTAGSSAEWGGGSGGGGSPSGGAGNTGGSSLFACGGGGGSGGVTTANAQNVGAAGGGTQSYSAGGGGAGGNGAVGSAGAYVSGYGATGGGGGGGNASGTGFAGGTGGTPGGGGGAGGAGTSTGGAGGAGAAGRVIVITY